MASTDNLIYANIRVKSMGHELEGKLDTDAKPGGAVEMAADGNYDPIVSTKAESLKRGSIVMVNADYTQGLTVDDGYVAGASGVRAKLFIPVQGDEVLALVKAAENISVGDKLCEEGGSSQFFVEAAGTETRYRLVALNGPGVIATGGELVRCRVL